MIQADWQNGIQKIERELSARCPMYAAYLQECNSPEKADQMLVANGEITENELQQIYCRNLNLPQDDEDVRAPERFPRISNNFLAMNSCIPYSWDESSMCCLFAAPYNIPQIIYELEEIFDRKATFRIVRRSLIDRFLAQVYSGGEAADTENFDSGDEKKLRSLAGEARIVKLVNEMIIQAIEQEASDIHIEPGEFQLLIRFRIDGLLREYMQLPLGDFAAIASRIKLIARLNIAESRRPQDGRINFKTGPYDLDLRFSTIPTLRGESLVMRLLRKDAMNCDLKQLGIPEDLLHSFEHLLNCKQGMILVVGPTGSGKTTTLYSSMMQLNDPSIKIITVEDPVEYQLPGLNQMQMNPQIGVTFADGLRHILRQDPDVILVGEIRDRETAEIAIQAAQTGHLVLSTLHTNDAAGAITRLQDMGIPGFLINSAVLGVLSQRLVRRVCSVCKGQSVKNGQKCRHCGSSGFRGRIGIYELLIFDDDVRQAVKRNCSSSEINKIAIQHGMIPLLQCGRNLVHAGITTEDELARAVSTGG